MSTTPEEYAEWAEEEERQERVARAAQCGARRFVRLLPRYPGEGNRLARRTAAKGKVRK